MSYLIKIVISIFLLSYPIHSYTNDEKKITISHLIQSAELTLKKINKNSDIKNFQKFLSRSRAILIFLEVYEGGFIFGAKGGNGVLLIKKGETKWNF